MFDTAVISTLLAPIIGCTEVFFFVGVLVSASSHLALYCSSVIECLHQNHKGILSKPEFFFSSNCSPLGHCITALIILNFSLYSITTILINIYIIIFQNLQAVEHCVELTDGYAARGLCQVLEVRISEAQLLSQSVHVCTN